MAAVGDCWGNMSRSRVARRIIGRSWLPRCTSKVTGATLIVAKLDRLSRDLAFLANLQKSGVHFLAADMPEANELDHPCHGSPGAA